MNETWKVFVFPMTSAILLWLCFPPISIGALAWLALTPLVVCAFRTGNTFSLWMGAYGAGVVFHLLGEGMFFAERLYRMDLQSGRLIAWLFAAIVGGLIWPWTIWAARILRMACHLPSAACFAVAWTAGEYVRKFGIGFITETEFPWLQLGLTQTEFPVFIQVADVGGVWLVTAVVALVNGWCVQIGLALRNSQYGKRSPFRLTIDLLWGAAMLGCLVLYGKWRLSQDKFEPGPIVCLMPADVLPDDLMSSKQPHPPPIENGSYPKADLYLWSETVLKEPVTILQPPKKTSGLSRLEHFAAAFPGPLVITCCRIHAVGVVTKHNSALVIDPRSGVQGWYDKIALVPWGEFQPWLRLPLQKKNTRHFDRGTRMPVFPLQLKHGKVCHFAITICYDTCFANVFRKAWSSANVPPDFFVTSSSESSGLRSKGWLQETMLRMTKLRAVETRRAIVRNVCSGPSCLIDSNGGLRWKSLHWEVVEPIAVGPIPLDHRRSLYVRWGDWLPRVFLTVIAAAAVLRLVAVRNRSPAATRSGAAHGDGL